METIKYLIVDDEPLAHQSLEILMKNYDQLKCIGNAYNAFKAFTFIKEHKPDLLFLDMDMPDMNGMELLKNLMQPIKVVITTAHPVYALEGYDYGVIDFLLKPIKAERLFKTMGKIIEVFSNAALLEKNSTSDITEEKQDYVFGTVDKKIFEKIYFDEIRYIEKVGNYLYIHASNGKSYYYLTSLKTMKSILPESEFSYANQSIIYSKSKIECPDGKNIVIKENLVYKISPDYKGKRKDKQ